MHNIAPRIRKNARVALGLRYRVRPSFRLVATCAFDNGSRRLLRTTLFNQKKIADPAVGEEWM